MVNLFYYDERPYSKPGGGFEIQPFTVRIDGYRQQGNLKIAREVAAIWNLPQDDFEYWKGIIDRIEFNQR